LRSQLLWFIRLRWCAAAGMVVGSLADKFWLHWYPHDLGAMGLGLTILAYNALLWSLTVQTRGGPGQRRGLLLPLAWAQIVLDLACLTVLALWTGGVDSPLLGFYVFHMVFASLLLPAVMAYGGAAVAMIMLCGGLSLTDHWPLTQGPRLILAGWCLTLLLTVFLANHVTRNLRRQRGRLVRQNRRIRNMAEHLRRHQLAMVQHEKMVAMGQMAAGVAHEIANPLASMDGLLQLMERRAGTAAPGSVPALREQVRRINAIVRQMTEFAHPSQAEWRVLPINEAVEKALAMACLDRRLSRVKMLKELGPAAGAVRVQPNGLQQVFLNLLLNAGDAMAETPEPKLVVRTERSGDKCTVSICDNGHGIRPENLARLFEPFFTTKPVGRGTGLGLSISYRLVSDMGGELAVTSTAGQGATFMVRLPIHAPASQERETASADIPIPEKPAPPPPHPAG
jgi:signal transduction histidine kinase